MDYREYAEIRLRGTVWQHVAPARWIYRSVTMVGRALGSLGVSANALTYASLVLAGASGVAAAGGSLTWAACLVLLSGLLDVLDGAVARAANTVTRYGALLDSTVDRLSDGLPLVGAAVFYGSTGPGAAIATIAMMGGFTVSYVRARAEALGVTLPSLFMRRAERVVLLALSFLLGSAPVASGVREGLLLAGLAVIAVLNFIATLAALRAARCALDAAPTVKPK